MAIIENKKKLHGGKREPDGLPARIQRSAVTATPDSLSGGVCEPRGIRECGDPAST